MSTHKAATILLLYSKHVSLKYEKGHYMQHDNWK